MAKYKLTNKAVEDLTEIWNYTFDKCQNIKQTSITKCSWKTATKLPVTLN